MALRLFHEKFALISFAFFSSLLSGLVLIGVCSSFSLMLSERGVNVSTITNILIATIPYSWKFAISPFIKNIIVKYRNSKWDAIKIISYISQFVLFSGFSCLGLFEKSGSLFLAGIIILLIVFAVSIHDIIRAHIKLTLFESKDFGFISAVENTGFRLGMFIAGACIIYIANSNGWFFAFIIVGLSVIFATISTFLMKKEESNSLIFYENQIGSLKEYAIICINFFKKYGIFVLILVIFSFKLTDSCISVLKPMFMHYLGISRLAFANISHLLGLFSMIISGIFAGMILYKIGIEKCIKLTFLMQMIASLIFMYFSAFKSDLFSITILVNVSTFVFGFSSVIFRTFVAQESRRDINMYTILLSIGSLIRIGSYTFAGAIVDNYSWGTIYFLCLISNIPGYFLYSKLRKKIDWFS